MHVIPNGGPRILYILTTIYAYQSFSRKKLFVYFPIIQYANHSLSSWTPVVVWPVSHGAIVVGRALQYPARAIVLEVI